MRRHPWLIGVRVKGVFLLMALLLNTPCAWAEDGYDLWLRYAPLEAEAREEWRSRLSSVVALPSGSPVANSAVSELKRGLGELLSSEAAVVESQRDGSIVIATPEQSALIRSLGLPTGELGAEGFLLRRIESGGKNFTVITAQEERGLLYGAFELLRRVHTGDDLEVVDKPRIERRLLNHWDNLDGHVERGYAGESLWKWQELPGTIDPRYTDYARAIASIGINGTVLNNVNASPDILTTGYLEKVAALADVFRPWGIRVYLSARFSAPVDIGGLATADPLDRDVRAWWKLKAGEIYALIPDFGGFLVKANSEGQPGPGDYGRSHADGANMLAQALAPHGGIVMWRAFVYASENPRDRVRQAYDEFKPLDGQFADNVLVQVKNGPLDFQPREPFHPMFGAMPETPLMMEFQLTKEYLGFSTHLAYLGTMWEEVLRSDTYAEGPGSSVARVVDGTLHDQSLTGIAGVANTGSDHNWSGSIFDQANWYAFGRLAWNPQLGAESIAREWLQLTFSRHQVFVDKAAGIMMRSREAVVDYMTPLGLAHLMGTGHHYGPAPWVDDLGRPEWNPFYYHRADREGIGFDRTASGSNAASQYAPPLAARFADRSRVPDEYLLWFHRVGWQEKLSSGATVWEELAAHYDRGVAEVEAMQKTWSELRAYVDPERFASVAKNLETQFAEARWWRDACLAYFQARSGLAFPPGIRPPARSLEHYQSLRFPGAPGWKP